MHPQNGASPTVSVYDRIVSVLTMSDTESVHETPGHGRERCQESKCGIDADDATDAGQLPRAFLEIAAGHAPSQTAVRRKKDVQVQQDHDHAHASHQPN